MNGTVADLAAWAASGAMALTGPSGGPPSAAPAAMTAAITAAAHDLARHTARWGRAVVVDGPALLGERAAITGMSRNGDTSVGGAARFVTAADGWVVLNLPRPEDVRSLGALVGCDLSPDDWPRLLRSFRATAAAEIVERATLLGMAVSSPGSSPTPTAPGRELAAGGRRTPSSRPLVVDLSSLWAGPLAASLLLAGGARVIKVEGRARADGARRGVGGFFDLLNAAKECVEIDFGDHDDRRLLYRLVAAADLVVEASRPRVMDELGIVPEALAAAGTSWISLTAYGRTGPDACRVGFGDDTAVAGGLFVPGQRPTFVADAVADPVAGLIAAALGAELLAGQRAMVLEVPLARAAAWVAGPTVAADVVGGGDRWEVVIGAQRLAVAAPRHRPVPPAASAVGAHDDAVRSEFAQRPG